jgi:hypothetical protein
MMLTNDARIIVRQLVDAVVEVDDDQLDELSKDTVASYARKAVGSISSLNRKVRDPYKLTVIKTKADQDKWDKQAQMRRKLGHRNIGLGKAMQRLAK